MTVRERFEKDLKALQDKLVKLCDYAQRALQRSLQAFEEQNILVAQKIITEDDIPDRLYEEIIDDSVWLITKQQPVASDLRKIVMTLKIATDYERVADFAVNIAKSTIQLNRRPEPIMKKALDNIKRMYEVSNEMLVKGLEAFMNEDIQLAKQVADMDDEVDHLYGETIKELFRVNRQNPNNIDYVAQLLFICRYLERTADHITNVAENVIYLVKGKHFDLNE